MHKRKREKSKFSKAKKCKVNRAIDISEDFIQECKEDFHSNPANIIARNAITTVGSEYSTTNADRVNRLNFTFMNTIKKKHLRATNQGHSGRCWMFAALNTLRHLFIKSLNLENFEFSETYLFFWDKFERCNSFIRWFIDHPDKKPGDRGFDYILADHMCDGGWWNTYANLVEKYGLIPKSAMTETAGSSYSEEMNKVLKDQLHACVNHLLKNRHKLSQKEQLKLKDETMKNIYNTLVKFLGEPPHTFSWAYSQEDEDTGTVIGECTPMMFKELVAPGFDMKKDFVVLSHIPSKIFPMHKTYKIKDTNNIYEGDCCTLCNVPINELEKYAMKSISAGVAVWFVGDVSQSFNYMHSALDDQLDASNEVFNIPQKFDKGERIVLRNIEGNHAMALTGFNVDHDGNVIEWQVENSWGYHDHETPGLDGFLTMSNTWFRKYVMEVVIHKDFLSRSMQKKASQKPQEIEPYDVMAPATKAGCVDPPKNYLQILANKKTFLK